MLCSADRRVWCLSLLGALTMFLVQPPADLWRLAWLAPLPWLWLIQADTLGTAQPWRVLWVGGLCYWLSAIHWLRLPHPATSIGWVALSAYLAIFVPLFIWTSRRLVHRWRWPLVVAAPLAWMALEQLRGWLLGGFTLAALGHTQWRWTELIQCADCFSACGVSGIVMAVAAGICQMLPERGVRYRMGHALCGAALGTGVLAAALCYGMWRMAGEPLPHGVPLEVLLVQGSIDTELKHDPAAAEQVVRQYDRLTVAALQAYSAGLPTPARPDLIVWPETMWRYGLLEIDAAHVLPESVVEQMLGPAVGSDLAAAADARQLRCQRALEQERLDGVGAFARRYATTWLVGLDKQIFTPLVPAGVQNFNCALFLDATGKVLDCYEKMHPVVFGEYLPLAERFPWLYRLTPLPAGLTAGTEPVAVRIADRCVATNICYETTLPEAVRSLVLTLEKQDRRPDLLVNLTNDGWFWGSSELDMHLTSAIFRAVEVRTPLVIAANTGLSASIDGSGRLLKRGPRRETATIMARVYPDGRRSPWLVWGSWPTGMCVAIVAVVMLEGWLFASALRIVDRPADQHLG